MHVTICPKCGRQNRGSVLPVHCPCGGTQPAGNTAATFAPEIRSPLPPPPAPDFGPGTELAKIIRGHLGGILFDWGEKLLAWLRGRSCKCSDWVAKMNRWGPDGCRVHFNEILARLKKVARGFGVPGAITSRVFPGWITLAIERAEEAEKEKGT